MQSKLFDKGNNVFTPSNIDVVQENATVYNFEVMSYNNYFVGLLGWMVHNACAKYTDTEMDDFAREYARRLRAGEDLDWDTLDPTLSDYMKQKIRKTAFDNKYLTDADKTIELHHFATNKNSKYTPDMKEISDKYGLDLDGDWNKAYLPHSGRHTDAYHEWVFEEMKNADNLANGDIGKFLEYYKEQVIKPATGKPGILYS